MFKSGDHRLAADKKWRESIYGKFLRFGISYLDVATRGIAPNDLILLGAPTGVGKTELCVQVALANIEDGRRVHFIALEADQGEIERRLLWALITKQFFDDTNRPNLALRLNMADWLKGEFVGTKIEEYEKIGIDYLSKALKNLFSFYKLKEFGVDELRQNVFAVADETDLVIIDHVHYFDWDDDNDNRAIKIIAKAARNISLLSRKPIILVAHLRKRDRNNRDMAPGVDEFHGSSDLTKIATKVITVARAPKHDLIDDQGKEPTFFRICKSRIDGSITRYVARMLFDYKTKTYDTKFRLSENGEEFTEVQEYPFWAKDFRDTSIKRLDPPKARVPFVYE